MIKKILIILLFFNFYCFSGENKFIIVIDPGHGGKDPGALSSSKKYLNEKDIVLDISQKVVHLLRYNLKDISIFLTRDSDEFIPLDKRSEIANKVKADLFISIHCNSRAKRDDKSLPRQFGTETYVMGIHKNEENLEVAKKENSVIILEEDYSTKYKGYDPNSPESMISMTFLQSAFLDQSLYFSSCMQKQFINVGRRDNGIKQAGFYVISFNSMPSVLIEVGYISDIEEEKYLNTNEGRKNIANAIFKAVKEYKNNFDKNKSYEKNIIENITRSDISYKIQLFSTSKKVNKNNKVFKDFKNVLEYKEGDFFKYIIGDEKKADDIFKLKEEAQNKGYSNTFIVIFKNNKKLSPEESKNYLNF